MRLTKKAGAVAGVVGLVGLGALRAPIEAAPSTTGAVFSCPSFCVSPGPVNGPGLLPDGFNQISWSGTWSQVSTSNTVPTTPAEYISLEASTVATSAGYQGSGTLWLYYYDYSGTGYADNEYRSVPVSVSSSNGAIRIDSSAGDLHIAGANAAGMFTGFGVRAQMG